MKITEIRAIPLAVPLQVSGPPSSWAAGAGKQILVRAVTDEGLTGWGECFAYGATEAVCHVVEDALSPQLAASGRADAGPATILDMSST